MFVAELWRYPVKSMGGERLPRARLGEDGIEGDRAVLVRSPQGRRIVTARSRPALLSLRATIGPDGEPLVDGRPWRDAEVRRQVEKLAGPGSRLERADDPGRFDVLPLLVATDGALQAAGYDWRRFRPNLIVGGVEGLAERGWEGRRLRAGAALIDVVDLRARCVMTTFDPDTQAQDPRVLRRIVEEFDGVLGLNCGVIEAGEVREGDPVELIEGP